MKKIAENVLTLLRGTEEELISALPKRDGETTLFPAAIRKLGNSAVLLGSRAGTPFLMIVAYCAKNVPLFFEGKRSELSNGGVLLECGLNAANGSALRRHFPWCVPHAAADPDLAVRVHTRPGAISEVPSAGDGLPPALPMLIEDDPAGNSGDDAAFWLFRHGPGAVCAAVRSVRTPEEATAALNAGVSTISLELGTLVRSDAAPEALPGTPLLTEYADKEFILEPGAVLPVSREAARRAVTRYADVVEYAVNFPERLGGCRRDFDLELSLAQSPIATTPAEYLFLVRELCRRGLRFSAFAPRFPERASLPLYEAVSGSYGGHRLVVGRSQAGLPEKLSHHRLILDPGAGEISRMDAKKILTGAVQLNAARPQDTSTSNQT